jgi:hypothetical protein
VFSATPNPKELAFNAELWRSEGRQSAAIMVVFRQGLKHPKGENGVRKPRPSMVLKPEKLALSRCKACAAYVRLKTWGMHWG